MKEIKVPVSYRLDESVKAWIDKCAKKDDRSSNYFLNQLIRQQMEQEQSQQESRQ